MKSLVQGFNMIATVRTFLIQTVRPERSWALMDGTHGHSVYVYSINDNQEEYNKQGIYVGIDLESGRCWVTGDPGWAIMSPKNSIVPVDGSPMSSDTQTYITGAIHELQLRAGQTSTLLASIGVQQQPKAPIDLDDTCTVM